MPQVPTDMFVDACKAVKKPMKIMFHHMVLGATLYTSSTLVGVGDVMVCIQQMSISLPSLPCLSVTTLKVVWFQRTLIPR